jgi:hypothetical protein
MNTAAENYFILSEYPSQSEEPTPRLNNGMIVNDSIDLHLMSIGDSCPLTLSSSRTLGKENKDPGLCETNRRLDSSTKFTGRHEFITKHSHTYDFSKNTTFEFGLNSPKLPDLKQFFMENP